MIYIHVPFCRSFCTYCAFYSEVQCRDDEIKLYLNDLLSEMQRRSQEIMSTRNTDTLYIGGGTPSVLPLGVLQNIVRNIPGGPVTDEFTVEVNPEDIVQNGLDYVQSLRSLGVNRISMGVQSLNPDALRWMNRRHSADGARQAFGLLRKGGFDNISVDIIYGFEGFDPASAVEIAVQWHPEHISAYQLGVEQGSALYDKVQAGAWAEASEEECRRQYEQVCRILTDAGYTHYEISNWSLEGKRARHNSAYWTRQPYAGLGPAAHSLGFGSGDGSLSGTEGPNIRSWNSETTSGWTTDSETLGPEEILEETLMLGLRTREGVPAALIKEETLARMLQTGALERNERQAVRIPEDRWFISDNIITDILV